MAQQKTPNRTGIRTVVYLAEKDRKELEKMSRETGAPLAYLLRRAVEQYVAKLKAKR